MKKEQERKSFKILIHKQMKHVPDLSFLVELYDAETKLTIS